MMFVPSFRSLIMKWNVKAAKKTVNDLGDDLADIGAAMSGVAIKTQKTIFDEHEETMKDIAKRQADIESESIEVKARALKKGLSQDSVYCKYCGEKIDKDSVFCKSCGKKQ